jgi:hypothetical protein
MSLEIRRLSCVACTRLNDGSADTIDEAACVGQDVSSLPLPASPSEPAEPVNIEIKNQQFMTILAHIGT